ncbi:hypothetical protein M0802_002586 [Mischocyttarus mexicanus]|nr:hypothetical protein M0802_002586 [Mischocyttarus mexicanus]
MVTPRYREHETDDEDGRDTDDNDDVDDKDEDNNNNDNYYDEDQDQDDDDNDDDNDDDDDDDEEVVEVVVVVVVVVVAPATGPARNLSALGDLNATAARGRNYFLSSSDCSDHARKKKLMNLDDRNDVTIKIPLSNSRLLSGNYCPCYTVLPKLIP